MTKPVGAVPTCEMDSVEPLRVAVTMPREMLGVPVPGMMATAAGAVSAPPERLTTAGSSVPKSMLCAPLCTLMAASGMTGYAGAGGGADGTPTRRNSTVASTRTSVPLTVTGTPARICSCTKRRWSAPMVFSEKRRVTLWAMVAGGVGLVGGGMPAAICCKPASSMRVSP